MPLVVFINPVESPRPERGELLKGYLSLGSLAAALRDRGFMDRMAAHLGYAGRAPLPAFGVAVVHLEPGLTAVQMAARLGAAARGGGPPIIVGVTAAATRLEWARTAARAARELWPKALLLAGGPHVSAAPESLVAPGAFQAACLGEGVETVAEIALRRMAGSGDAIAGIAGLCRLDLDGAIRRNPPRRFAFDLDDYPPPSRSLDLFLPGGRREAAGPDELVFLLAGYGCPCDCSFCAQRAIHDGRIRERSAEGIFREMQELHACGFRSFALVQESLLNRRKRIDRFLGLIASSGLDLRWTAEARCDQLDRGLLERMKAAGLKMIQIGLESGDAEILAKIGKGLDLERAAAVIRTCRELQIDTAVYLLVGLPDQDWRSLLRSARFLMKNPPFNRATGHVAVAVALPYPGTRMARENAVRVVNACSGRDWPARNPVVRLDPDGAFRVAPVAETDCLTAEEVSEAFFFLDDFCQFLIASSHAGLADRAAREKAAGYAARMLAMIVQRTLRDLAAGAQAERRAGLEEILRRHGPENRLAEMTAPELGLGEEALIDFLCRARIESGHEALRGLDWRRRLRVVQRCARRWTDSGRAFARVEEGLLKLRLDPEPPRPTEGGSL